MHHLRIGRKLEFSREANRQENIYGNPSYEKCVLYDDFLGGAVKGDWVEGEANGGTIAQAALQGGALTMTTGATIDDNAELAHGIQWSGTKSAVFEARVKVDVITTVAMVVGFNDSAAEGNDVLPFEITAGAATLVNGKTTNGVAFIFDTDGSVDYWYMAATKADAEGTPVVTAYAPVADTYEIFRIELDTSGNATFYRNGIAIGYQAACITAATLLTPYIGVMARTTSARVLTVDYVKCWQDR